MLSQTAATISPVSTLILGIGNSLLTDDGVGIHVINALQEPLGSRNDIELMDGGTLSFTLAGPLAEAGQLIVVDAAQLGAPPGTLRVFENEAMDEYLYTGKRSSVHEVGLVDLFSINRLTGEIPQRRALVAIQPENTDWGEHPTAAVAAAVTEAQARILELLERWAQ